MLPLLERASIEPHDEFFFSFWIELLHRWKIKAKKGQFFRLNNYIKSDVLLEIPISTWIYRMITQSYELYTKRLKMLSKMDFVRSIRNNWNQIWGNWKFPLHIWIGLCCLEKQVFVCVSKLLWFIFMSFFSWKMSKVKSKAIAMYRSNFFIQIKHIKFISTYMVGNASNISCSRLVIFN